MKVALAVVFLLAAAGAMGMGFVSAPASTQKERTVPALEMRGIPGAGKPLLIAKTQTPSPKKTDDDLEDLKPVAKAPEAGPAVEKVEVKPAEPKPTSPAAVAAKPPPPEAKAPPEPKAKSADAKPAPVAKTAAPKAAGAEKAATGGTAGVTDGSLSLRASDTADVFIDGRKVGSSPVLGHRVKAGKHKIRFDCYDASGEAHQGTVQTVEVAIEGERDVEYECPSQ